MPRLHHHILFASLALAAAASCSAKEASAPHSDLRVISHLALGGDGGWDYLSFDAPHRHLFVSRGDRVLVVDVDKGQQVATIPGTDGVHGIALAPDLRRGYTSDGKSSSVTVFDLGTLKTVATLHVTGKNPDAIVYDSASHHVFTLNGRSGNASVIDTAKNAVIDTIALSGRPEFAVADGAGHVFVNIEDKSELAEIDTTSNKVTQVWPLAPCASPSGLAIDAPHHRLFSVCDNQKMAVIDDTNGRLVASVPIGDGPDAVVFDPSTAMVYSSNGESGTITAVHEDDPDHYTVTATVPTQRSARTLALDSQKQRLYLSAAQFGHDRQPNGRYAMVPGSFTVLVVGKP